MVLSNKDAVLPSNAANPGDSLFEQMDLQSIRRSRVLPLEAISPNKGAGRSRIATKTIPSFHMRATHVSIAKCRAVSTNKAATRLRIREDIGLPSGLKTARLSITDNTGMPFHRRIDLLVVALGLVVLVNKTAARLSVAEDTDRLSHDPVPLNCLGAPAASFSSKSPLLRVLGDSGLLSHLMAVLAIPWHLGTYINKAARLSLGKTYLPSHD